jgi:hypothetical protein
MSRLPGGSQCAIGDRGTIDLVGVGSVAKRRRKSRAGLEDFNNLAAIVAGGGSPHTHSQDGSVFVFAINIFALRKFSGNCGVKQPSYPGALCSLKSRASERPFTSAAA